jgi:hypothetical protein
VIPADWRWANSTGGSGLTRRPSIRVYDPKGVEEHFGLEAPKPHGAGSRYTLGPQAVVTVILKVVDSKGNMCTQLLIKDNTFL